MSRRQFVVLALLLTGLVLLAGCRPGGAVGEPAGTGDDPAASTVAREGDEAGSRAVEATNTPPPRTPTPTVMPVVDAEPLPTEEIDRAAGEIRLGWLTANQDVHLLPDPGSEILGELPADQLVIVSAVYEDWFEVVYGESRRGYGWIAQNAVAFEQPEAPAATRRTPTRSTPQADDAEPAVEAEATAALVADTTQGTVLAPELNVRSGPGVNNPVLGRLRRGDSVDIVDRRNGWLQIRYPGDGPDTAWVSAGYVAVQGEPTPRAPVSAAPRGAAGTLVFQERSGGNIYVMNADGSNLRRLTNGLDPALSPDGSQVAFTRWDVPRGLYVINIDGTGERRLIGENLIKNPTWSPDGRRLSFNQQLGGQDPFSITIPGGPTFNIPEDPHWRLGVIDASGATESRDGVPDQKHSFNPSWDGRGILYAGDGGLHITDPGGSSRPFFTTNSQLRHPSWAPDGSAVIAVMEFHDHWEIVRIPPDGSGFQSLTQNSQKSNSVAPTWSPDGRSILFLTDRRGRWEMWIMNADGSNQRPFAPQALADMDFRYDFAAEHVVDWGS